METILVNLKTAVRLIENGEADRAAWRIADAGLLLRDYLEEHDHHDLAGLDEATGRGAMLPMRAVLDEHRQAIQPRADPEGAS